MMLDLFCKCLYQTGESYIMAYNFLEGRKLKRLQKMQSEVGPTERGRNSSRWVEVKALSRQSPRLSTWGAIPEGGEDEPRNKYTHGPWHLGQEKKNITNTSEASKGTSEAKITQQFSVSICSPHT